MSTVNVSDILRYRALPILLALGMGLLVTCDFSLASYHPLWQFMLGHKIMQNYLWTATAFALLIVTALGFRYRGWMFDNRYRITAILLIAAPALGGLNLARLDPPDVAVILATLFWLASVLVEDRPVLVPRAVIALLLGLAFFAVGSVTTGGPYIVLSLPSVFTKLMVLFLLANLIATPRDYEIALKALIVVAVVSAFISILAEGVYLLTGYAFTFDDRAAEHFKCFGWICVFRATGLAPTPQVLGHLLIMGIGLTLFLQVRTWLRLLMIAVLLVGAMCTMSVGVGLTICVMLALFPIFRWPSRYLHILSAYAAIAWLVHVTGIGAWAYRSANELLLASYGVNVRVWTYRAGAELIAKHPVFGIGALKQIPGSMHFTTPHNTYLEIALELGLPAAFLFTALLCYLFISCWLIVARAPDVATRRWMSGLLLGFTGMLVHFISEPMFPNNLPWTYMGLVTAGIIIYRRAGNVREREATVYTISRPLRLARKLRNAGCRR